MEEDLNVQEGVEDDELANHQEEVTEEIDQDVVVPEGEESEDEDEASEGQASEGDNTGVETSKAFAERLGKKTKQIEQQYMPYKSVIEKLAEAAGITADEYVQEMQKQLEEEARERELEADRAKYGDLPDEVIEKIKKADELETKLKETERWNKEASDLKKAFPNIKTAEDIPDEVFIMRNTQGIPLVTAMKAYMFDNQSSTANAEKLRIEAEQKAIKQLQQNTASPGLLGGQGSVDTRKSISEMSDAEFEKLKEEVKSGRRKTLF
jgi:hypothetical protein